MDLETYEAILGMKATDEDAALEGPLAGIVAFHEMIHGRILAELADISEEELELPSVYWESGPLSVRFRLHRFESHMRQHTVQIDKTLVALGHGPSRGASPAADDLRRAGWRRGRANRRGRCWCRPGARRCRRHCRLHGRDRCGSWSLAWRLPQDTVRDIGNRECVRIMATIQSGNARQTGGQRYRHLFEHAPICIFVIDLTASPVIILEANRRAELVYGYTTAELMGMQATCLVPQDAEAGSS